jgi:hypothetical protein
MTAVRGRYDVTYVYVVCDGIGEMMILVAVGLREQWLG